MLSCTPGYSTHRGARPGPFLKRFNAYEKIPMGSWDINQQSNYIHEDSDNKITVCTSVYKYNIICIHMLIKQI